MTKSTNSQTPLLGLAKAGKPVNGANIFNQNKMLASSVKKAALVQGRAGGAPRNVRKPGGGK